MGFDTAKKNKLKESMDYDSNRRLTAVANKAATIDAPILIIGLGGTGVNAVIKVKKMIYDRIQCEVKENGEVMDKPQNIEYLILDTDAANKNISEGGIRFSNRECLIYTSGDIQAKLQSPNLPGYISSWINKGIDIKEVINGAGAVRQLGRFMLFDNIQKVVEVLETKIQRVTANYANSVPLYVFIFSGICGGTGSGTFLDIPYLVRGVAKRIDGMRIVQRIGLLFLPDVNLSIPGVDDVKKEGLRKNGFAALKELDYLMSVSTTGDCFEQEYGDLHIGDQASGDMPPYETCILMSSRNADGITRADGSAYNYTLTVAAETVLGFIAAETLEEDQTFSINSFLSNNVSTLNQFLSRLGDEIRPVHYSYVVAGGSSAVLPLDDIMSYLAFLAFQEVDGQWNRIPEPDEVREVLDHFGLDVRGMTQELTSQAPPSISDEQRHTYDRIKQAPQMVLSDFQGQLDQRKMYIRNKARNMLESMKSSIEDKNNLINESFRDVKKGPVFAQRLLFTPSDNYCVGKEIAEIKRQFMASAPSTQLIDSLKGQVDSKMRELKNSSPILAWSKNKLRNELITALEDYYNALFQQESYKVLEQLCNDYNEIFMTKNNEIYSCAAEMLETLIELFQKFASIKTEAIETRNGNAATLSWSIVDVPVFIRELENKIKNNGDLNVNMQAFIRNFYSYLYENFEIWNGSKRTDLVENLNSFISEQFSNVLNKSMDFYIEFIANAQGTAVTEYSQKICSELLKRSKIKFPMCATYNLELNPGYSFVSVPTGTQIGGVIKAGVKGMVLSKNSEIKDRLVMMNFKTNVPLYAFSELRDCYNSYSKVGTDRPGLHLYESARKDWRDIPSPLPQAELEGGHFVENEAIANQRWAEIFDKAVEYGFIRLEGDGARQNYNCYWGEPINPEQILKQSGLDLQGDVDVRAALKCLNEISEKLNDHGRLGAYMEIFRKRNKTLNDEKMTRVIDEEFSKAIFIKMVMVRDQIKRMVEDYEKCMEILEMLRPFCGDCNYR